MGLDKILWRDTRDAQDHRDQLVNNEGRRAGEQESLRTIVRCGADMALTVDNVLVQDTFTQQTPLGLA